MYAHIEPKLNISAEIAFNYFITPVTRLIKLTQRSCYRCYRFQIMSIKNKNKVANYSKYCRLKHNRLFNLMHKNIFTHTHNCIQLICTKNSFDLNDLRAETGSVNYSIKVTVKKCRLKSTGMCSWQSVIFYFSAYLFVKSHYIKCLYDRLQQEAGNVESNVCACICLYFTDLQLEVIRFSFIYCFLICSFVIIMSFIIKYF